MSLVGFRANNHPQQVARNGRTCSECGRRSGLVHDQTYTTVCSGCRADEIASETA